MPCKATGPVQPSSNKLLRSNKRSLSRHPEQEGQTDEELWSKKYWHPRWWSIIHATWAPMSRLSRQVPVSSTPFLISADIITAEVNTADTRKHAHPITGDPSALRFLRGEFQGDCKQSQSDENRLEDHKHPPVSRQLRKERALSWRRDGAWGVLVDDKKSLHEIPHRWIPKTYCHLEEVADLPFWWLRLQTAAA